MGLYLTFIQRDRHEVSEQTKKERERQKERERERGGERTSTRAAKRKVLVTHRYCLAIQYWTTNNVLC